jgi:hypothetical protein
MSLADWTIEASGLEHEDEGVEFPSLEAAYDDAAQAAVDIHTDACCEGQCATEDAFEIRDESGRLVIVLPCDEELSRREMIAKRMSEIAGRGDSTEVVRRYVGFARAEVAVSPAKGVPKPEPAQATARSENNPAITQAVLGRPIWPDRREGVS